MLGLFTEEQRPENGPRIWGTALGFAPHANRRGDMRPVWRNDFALSGLLWRNGTVTQGGGQTRGARLTLPWAIGFRSFGAGEGVTRCERRTCDRCAERPVNGAA